jgi:hypothetical protein
VRPAARLAALLGACSLGCKAETLGVEVPRGGPEAISVEDLQRDAFALRGPEGTRAVGSPGHRAATGHFAQRLQQMRMIPGFGREWTAPLEGGGLLVCGQKDGRGPGAVVVLARDPGEGPTGPVDLAGLISLAKAHDTPTRPAVTLVLCGQFAGEASPSLGASPPVPVDGRRGPVLVVGGLGAEGTPTPGPGAALASGGPTESWPAGPGPSADSLDGVDYRVIAGQVGALHAEVQARMR